MTATPFATSCAAARPAAVAVSVVPDSDEALRTGGDGSSEIGRGGYGEVDAGIPPLRPRARPRARVRACCRLWPGRGRRPVRGPVRGRAGAAGGDPGTHAGAHHGA